MAKTRKMKKILFLLLFVFTSGVSQNLTMQDLVSLQQKQHTEIKQHFIDSGWKLVDERYSDKRQYGDIVFMSSAIPDATTMHLTIFYGWGKISQNRLQLRIKDKEQFAKLKSGIEPAGLKFVSAETASNKTTVIFSNEAITIQAITTKPVGAQAQYEIYIIDNTYDPKMYNYSLGK